VGALVGWRFCPGVSMLVGLRWRLLSDVRRSGIAIWCSDLVQRFGDEIPKTYVVQ
jgi:hypothetical protein